MNVEVHAVYAINPGIQGTVVHKETNNKEETLKEGTRALAGETTQEMSIKQA